MNTTKESSELSSSKTTMALTTTFSKSTKKGLAVLAALCMLSFYTGHLSNGGDGAQSAVSLLRNEKLDDVTNDIVDNDGVEILSTICRPCKFDYVACLGTKPSPRQKERCKKQPTTRVAEVRDRSPDSCDWYCGNCCNTRSWCVGDWGPSGLCSHILCNGDTVFPPDGNFDRTCHAYIRDRCPAYYNYKPMVDCGGHCASSCANCPQGKGKGWCNGDCTWLDGDDCVRLIPIL